MVTLNKNDLSHILAQIKIAEEHTRLINEGMDPGAALAQLVTSPLVPYGLRTVDGSFNNFQPGMEHFGAADEVMTRLLTPNFAPAETDMRTGQPTSYEQFSGSVYDSEPRTVSNLVADQTLNNPAAIAAALAVAGVTGAEQLAAVQLIVAAHREAEALRAVAEAAGAGDSAAVAAAEANLALAQDAVTAATNALAGAVSAQADADAALASAEAVLAAAEAALAGENPAAGTVADAQSAVAAAQLALDNALAAANAAQDDLDLAIADLAAKEAALVQAIANRDAAQALVTQLLLDVGEAQVALDDAQAALDALPPSADIVAAQTAVTTAATNLTALEDLAATAAVNLQAAEDELALAQAEFDAATLAVDTATTAKASADSEAASAQSTLDAETTELAQANADFVSAFATLSAAMASGDQVAVQEALAAFNTANSTLATAHAEYDAAFAADQQADIAAADAAAALTEAEDRLTAAETDLANKQALRDAAFDANETANQNVALAETALAEAETALADAIATDADILQATALRDAAAADLAALQAAAAVAADQLALREADVVAAQAERDTAAQAVTDAQGVLNQKTDEAQTAETALASAQAALAAAEALEAATGDVASATAAVASAQTAADAAAQAVVDAQGVLASEESDLAAAQATLDATQAPFEASAAAEAADATLAQMLVDHGIEMEGDTVFIRNVAADLGATASFNGFMTIFGQFFDHGLDLTNKGGSGNVIIPLNPDDPLYVPGAPTNFMVLTRATNDPGPDGLVGTADDIRDHNNQTTPWSDLNQLYTSNPSHQVFLREYVMTDTGPLATGMMLAGEFGGPPTWAEVKAQARDLLGIELSDLNVHSVPLLLTDLYGEFVRGDNGFPQMMTASGPVEGDPAAPISGLDALSAGRGFLDDIAHNAVPKATVDHDRNPATAEVAVTPDADGIIGNPIIPNQFGIATEYDNELLDAHFIVGDGRGNENIALTSIHTMFHAEHNRQIAAVKDTLTSPDENGVVDLALLNEYLLVPVTEVPADLSTLVWDGERLFQTGRFSTEMVYQHLVFEEFARALAPDIDPFVFSNSAEVDGAIFEEFAQVVYRFGHSMLTENVELMQLVGGAATPAEMELLDAFLNPVAFTEAGVDAEAAAGAILRGMARQPGNEIDEFMTEALRNNLLGLPLDLAALNMARARETGIPSLNEARRQFYEQTNDTYLQPYDSWTDFAAHLKNPLSVVNFIAAYGTHDSITSATTMAEKRDAAWALVFGTEGESAAEREARLDYVNATGAWAGVETGLNDVDFWIGGLAEELMTFGGMLGSTFTFVFEMQLENLQAGDRFYYLSRTQGMHLLTELEADGFAELMRRTTDTEHTGLHTAGAAFTVADYIIEMNQALQYNEGLGNADPTREADILTALTGNEQLVQREDTDGDGDIDSLIYLGDEHVVIGGTDEADHIVAGDGDDTVWGEAGDDRIEGGYGVDHLLGGEGDDIITDSGTDIGAADVIAGEGGDDFIRAPSGGGAIFGNEGSDWMEGNGMMNTLSGDNSELFFNSPVIGHDVMISGPNDTDYDGESGDDVMIQGIGVNRNNGMAGFDWLSYQGNNYAVDADMNIGIFVNQQANILRDRFDLVEGLSGWTGDDILSGREVPSGAADVAGNAAQVGDNAPIESFSNTLLEKNLHLVDGLAELVAHLERFEVTHPNGTTDETLIGVMDTSDASDIILGGGGSDIIRGRAGNDIIDGDKFLQVRLAVNAPDGSPMGTASGLTGQVFALDGSLMFEGRTLDTLLFSRDVVPAQLAIVREIIDGSQDGDIDVAEFWDVRDNYTITQNPDGSITVTHDVATVGAIDPTTGRNREIEGTDRLTNVEVLRFADQDVVFTNAAPVTGADNVILGETGTFSVADGALLANDTDPEGDPLSVLSVSGGAAGLSVARSGAATDVTATDTAGGSFAYLATDGAAAAPGNVTVSVDTVGQIDGSAGDDIILTGSGAADTLIGGIGNDRLDGRGGADTIEGGEGDDTIFGRGGADTIQGGAGNDVLNGNGGNDNFIWFVGDGRDVVSGGANGAVGDTFTLNGSTEFETFLIMTTARFLSVNPGATLAAGTEIVITRNGGAKPTSSPNLPGSRRSCSTPMAAAIS